MTAPVERKPSILVVDDDCIILDSLGEFLRLEGYEVATASSFGEAVRVIDGQSIDLIISDVNMPGGNGFELLHVVRKKAPETAVIMITAYGTIESAVEAIKMGAYDYLTKPIIDDELKLCVQRSLAQQAVLRENRILKEKLELRFGLDAVIGHDYRMLKVFDLVEAVAGSKVTVLVQGKSGTGKSLIARVVHQRSERREEPFIEVSCGAIPETLLESELFGHVRGAFTGAVATKAGKFKAAHGGTIFLDEIAASSPGLQVKLLRVLQTQQFEPVGSNKTETVDVRVILASNVDLEEEVKAGRFREDLYYRINVVTIDMPTLAERVGDIPLLADHFLKLSCAEMKREILGFDDEALQLLQRYDWPGSVRELENAVARAVVLCKGRRIGVNDLPPRLVETADATEPAEVYTPKPLKEALEQPEKRILEAALRANGWNRQLTAQQLGINRTTLYKKMKRYGLEGEPAHTR
ncbi:MAG: sigma-54-dependent Fis family transcriptional regulator [Phycisphaerales bacterium]|nr:MAG: sigma-54-dependent Fis family transcriptional regulator [Phycisphaerales bacterium]